MTDSPPGCLIRPEGQLRERNRELFHSRAVAWIAVNHRWAGRRRRTSEDPTIVERGERLLHDLLRITAELGGTHFTGALYSAFRKYHRRSATLVGAMSWPYSGTWPHRPVTAA